MATGLGKELLSNSLTFWFTDNFEKEQEKGMSTLAVVRRHAKGEVLVHLLCLPRLTGGLVLHEGASAWSARGAALSESLGGRDR